MPNISVGKTREKAKAPSSQRPGVEARRKAGAKAKTILADRKKEGRPRTVKVAQTHVTFTNVSDDVISECTECGYENWKWLTQCAKCKTPPA